MQEFTAQVRFTTKGQHRFPHARLTVPQGIALLFLEDAEGE
ncbi:MAG: hypothetical protein U0350_41185 [Caldilineaceae bacterium]